MKGMTFVIIYSIFMLALFGVMCYLMTIVNPAVVVVEQPKKEKTTLELPGNETHVFYTRDDDKDLLEIPSSNETKNSDLKSKRINDTEFNFSKTNHLDKAINLEVKRGDLKIRKVAKGRRSVNSLKRYCKQNEKYVILNILDENNEPKIEIKLNVIPNERKRDEIYQNLHKSRVNKTRNEIFEEILLKDFVVKILSNNSVVIDAIEKLETRKNMITATLNTTNYNINEDTNNITKIRDNVINFFENKNRFNDIELHVLTYLKVDKTNISNETNLTIEKFQNDYATKTKDSKAPIGKNMSENIERFNLFNLTKEDEDVKGMNSHRGGLFYDNNLNEFEPFNVNLSTNNVTIQLSNEIERFKSDNADNFQVKENLELVKNINNTPFNDNQKIGVKNYTTSNNFNMEAEQLNVLKEIKFIGEKNDANGKNHTIQTRKKVSNEIVIKDSKKINSTIEKVNINKMPLYLHEKFNVTLFNHDLLKLNFGLVNTTNKNYNISDSKELF